MQQTDDYPGLAFVRNGWRLIIDAREIRRGNHKGKYEVTLPRYEFGNDWKPGKKAMVKRSAIKEFPSIKIERVKNELQKTDA